MGKVAILAGFEPFGSYPVNPTADLARELDGKEIDGVLIKGVVMPASYHFCHVEVIHAAREMDACRIVSFGLASWAPKIKIEEVGENWMASRYADCDGIQADGERLCPFEQTHRYVNSNTDRLKAKFEEMGVRCLLSQHAETYVCNAMIYNTLRALELYEMNVPYVHMHTPWTNRNLRDVEVDPLKKVVIQWEMLERAAIIACTTLSLKLQDQLSMPL